VTFVAYSPLGRGFLSGAIKTEDDLSFEDRRRLFPRFAPEHFAANRPVLDAIEDVVAARGYAAAQVALAWVLGKSDHIVPIPGSKRLTHIEQNAAAIDIEISPTI
jgi:aryl-alcohol dehydrogenase-like predicted oxidoreductase